ncbi:hypothetical protein CYJ37_03960 [Bacillus sp. UMB0728]|nr:hypothetical protein CYJ37_03960 [Bacillus sp. UMB0728]
MLQGAAGLFVYQLGAVALIKAFAPAVLMHYVNDILRGKPPAIWKETEVQGKLTGSIERFW